MDPIRTSIGASVRYLRGSRSFRERRLNAAREVVEDQIVERRSVNPSVLDVVGGLVLLAIAALLVGVALIVAAS